MASAAELVTVVTSVSVPVTSDPPFSSMPPSRADASSPIASAALLTAVVVATAVPSNFELAATTPPMPALAPLPMAKAAEFVPIVDTFRTVAAQNAVWMSL
jgi:hypothetical protein